MSVYSGLMLKSEVGVASSDLKLESCSATTWARCSFRLFIVLMISKSFPDCTDGRSQIETTLGFWRSLTKAKAFADAEQFPWRAQPSPYLIASPENYATAVAQLSCLHLRRKLF